MPDCAWCCGGGYVSTQRQGHGAEVCACQKCKGTGQAKEDNMQFIWIGNVGKRVHAAYSDSRRSLCGIGLGRGNVLPDGTSAISDNACKKCRQRVDWMVKFDA